jgi:large subunit ribosomal protein L23
MNSFEIIKTVRLTEKGTRQGMQEVRYTTKSKDGKTETKTRPLNQYTVVADPRANKTQIRQAVQELFKVKVTKVNTLNVRGKFRRQRTKQAGQSSNWKKAIVTLKQGDKIELT